jgi:hypothetical protein
VTVHDEIAAARLEWLDAEAQLAELLPAGPVQRQATTAAETDVADLTAAIHRSEQAHAAYMQVIRRWTGLANLQGLLGASEDR